MLVLAITALLFTCIKEEYDRVYADAELTARIVSLEREVKLLKDRPVMQALPETGLPRDMMARPMPSWPPGVPITRDMIFPDKPFYFQIP